MSSCGWCRRTRHPLVLAVGLVAATGAVTAAPPVEPPAEKSTRQVAVELLDRMPLLFVPEQVSPDGAMGFAVRGSKAGVWLSDRGLAYRLYSANDVEATAASWVVALDLVGATPRQPVGGDPLPTKVSFFKGPKEQWRTGLPTYGSVRYRQPWPGVDVVVSGTAGELKSTFVVRPGVDPGLIRLAYRGATEVRIEPDGSLVVATPLGDIREQAPVAYQEVAGRRVEVAAAFDLEQGSGSGHQAYRFRLGEHDPSRELVIDPVTLIYCGYIGGSQNEVGRDIAIDAIGKAYVTGTTTSTEATFPVAVGPDLSHNDGYNDAFVAKVNAAGTALDYCGYIGGDGKDFGEGIAADAAGNAYVTGRSSSTEATFPVTVGPDLSHNGGHDAFVAKVNATGTTLEYCGYIGGSSQDWGADIALDASGNAYVTGRTRSTEATFPVAVGPDLSYNDVADDWDAFVAKVNAAGTGLDYCGYIGGLGSDEGIGITCSDDGSAYVTGTTWSSQVSFPVAVGPDLTYNFGYDAFVAKVNAAGTGLDYCGYIGGSRYEWGRSIATDAAGNAYVTGETSSSEDSFPVTVGPDLTYSGQPYYFDFDAFVAKVSATGTALDYCGYIGGWGVEEAGRGIAVDAAGQAYVTGFTDSTEESFPVTVGPDLTFNGSRDAFVAKVNAGGTALGFCGYIGGALGDFATAVAVDGAGGVYVTGWTKSTEATLPVMVGPDLSHNGNQDAFVAKLRSLELLFSDGFESGDVSAWSATVP